MLSAAAVPVIDKADEPDPITDTPAASVAASVPASEGTDSLRVKRSVPEPNAPWPSAAPEKTSALTTSGTTRTAPGSTPTAVRTMGGAATSAVVMSVTRAPMLSAPCCREAKSATSQRSVVTWAPSGRATPSATRSTPSVSIDSGAVVSVSGNSPAMAM